MKYVVMPEKKFVEGYCLGCGTNCDNKCVTQCLDKAV